MIPVPITGLGCICATGDGAGACLEGLFAGRRNPAPPVGFSSTHSVAYPVFEVPGFLNVPGMPRTSALGLHAARQALDDAGLDPEALDGLRVGVCVGTTVGSALSHEAFCRAHRAGEDPDMDPMECILKGNPADIIARAFGFRGPRQTIVNACASGTDAIGLGASWIEAGLCDLVIAGGTDELGRVTYNGFISLKIMDPAPCRPFDRDRRGLNLGEGAAMVVLESERSRSRRRAPARAFLLGYGSSCDAYHQTAPHPDGAGLRRAMAEALGGVAASSIAFVNAHGTGTPDNDRVESRVLGELMPGVPYLSTKGSTGHTLGAAGAIEAVFTALCLEWGSIPASLGFENLEPGLTCAPVCRATKIEGAAALSTSLAFGGNNAVVLIGRGERP